MIWNYKEKYENKCIQNNRTLVNDYKNYRYNNNTADLILNWAKIILKRKNIYEF
jgi:hypothetical protein